MLNIFIAVMFAVLGLSVSLVLEKINIAIHNKLKYTHKEVLVDVLLVILGVVYGLGLITFIITAIL